MTYMYYRYFLKLRKLNIGHIANTLPLQGEFSCKRVGFNPTEKDM